MMSAVPEPNPRPVKKCVCFDTTFAALRDAGISSLQEAAERFGCGSNCGLCRPYISRMLETGETEFEVMNSPEGQPSA